MFTSKAGAYPIKLHSLSASPSNIRLGWKWLRGAKSPAFYGTELNTPNSLTLLQSSTSLKALAASRTWLRQCYKTFSY
jgi:hypothetical protein